MEAKFTKGPWAIIGSRDDGGLQICHKPSGGIVATIESTLGYAEADEANARLIAAAPELYELALIIDNLLGTPKAKMMDALKAKARAALAKARGESQA